MKKQQQHLKPLFIGEVVSVDIMVSPKSCKYATTYVDQASRLSFAYMQHDSAVENTLKGKEAFERFAMTHTVVICSYHANNAIFKEKGWMEHCCKYKQAMTFAAVHSRHQSGIAKRRMKQLQDKVPYEIRTQSTYDKKTTNENTDKCKYTAYELPYFSHVHSISIKTEASKDDDKSKNARCTSNFFS